MSFICSSPGKKPVFSVEFDWASICINSRRNSITAMKIMHVVGARPNFMKTAPLYAAMAREPRVFEQVLVHTGQHYDFAMSGVFFSDLGLPVPDECLGVGGGSHAEQTAA